MQGRHRRLILNTVACSALIAPAAANAQASAEQLARGGMIEEVVVTARRVEESIQTTPVAVTAVGLTTIKNAQIIDTTGLQRVTPGLSVATGSPGNSGFTYLSIRGSGTVNAGVANDPAIAVYVDGVYIPRPSQGVTDLIDLQRAEILRGPQGTLFGRNTTGGALNIVTAQPTGNFEGEVRARIGNYDLVNAGLTVNLPLAGDELAARLVYDFTDRDGYGRNAALGHDVNDRHSHFVRGTLRWAPADSDWSVALSGDYDKLKDHGQFIGLVEYNPTANGAIGALSAGGALDPFLHTKSNWYTMNGQPFFNNFYNGPIFRGGTDSYDDLEAYGAALNIQGRVGPFDVKSITGYRYSYSIGSNELDGTPVGILASESAFTSKQWSQELQFSGEIGDRLEYIFGAYYSTEDGVEASLSQAFGAFGPAAPPPNFGYSINLADVSNDSRGVYAQANYHLTEALRLTAGLRWTWDKRDVVLHNVTNVALNTCSPELTGQVGFTAPCSFPRDASFDYPAWTLGLDYQATEDLFLYVKTSRASKAGGYNVRNGSASTPPFKPERVDDVELGAKYTSPDGRFRVNAALYHVWQSDVQRTAAALVTIGGVATSTRYLLNAGDQRITGGEIEFSVVPWEGMTLGANLSAAHGKYKKGSFTEVRDIPGANLPGCTPVPNNITASRCVVDRSGENLVLLPELQFNISATQVIPTSIGEVTLFANYAFIGDQYFDANTADPREPPNTQLRLLRENDLGKTPDYGLLDARVSLQLPKPDVELYVFAKNLLDKKYASRRFSGLYTGAGVAIEYIGQPRTYGVGAVFRWH